MSFRKVLDAPVAALRRRGLEERGWMEAGAELEAVDFRLPGRCAEELLRLRLAWASEGGHRDTFRSLPAWRRVQLARRLGRFRHVLRGLHRDLISERILDWQDVWTTLHQVPVAYDALVWTVHWLPGHSRSKGYVEFLSQKLPHWPALLLEQWLSRFPASILSRWPEVTGYTARQEWWSRQQLSGLLDSWAMRAGRSIPQLLTLERGAEPVVVGVVAGQPFLAAGAETLRQGLQAESPVWVLQSPD